MLVLQLLGWTTRLRLILRKGEGYQGQQGLHRFAFAMQGKAPC